MVCSRLRMVPTGSREWLCRSMSLSSSKMVILSFIFNLASRTTMEVTSLVREAIGSTSWTRFCTSNSPVCWSWTRAEAEFRTGMAVPPSNQVMPLNPKIINSLPAPINFMRLFLFTGRAKTPHCSRQSTNKGSPVRHPRSGFDTSLQVLAEITLLLCHKKANDWTYQGQSRVTRMTKAPGSTVNSARSRAGAGSPSRCHGNTASRLTTALRNRPS